MEDDPIKMDEDWVVVKVLLARTDDRNQWHSIVSEWLELRKYLLKRGHVIY